MTCLAVDYMDLQNFNEATRWFRKAADLGFPDAQLMLGSAYDAGKGVAKDGAEAVRWYRRAAEQGDTTAQSIMGGMYLNGDDVEKDISSATYQVRGYGVGTVVRNQSTGFLAGPPGSFQC